MNRSIPLLLCYFALLGSCQSPSSSRPEHEATSQPNQFAKLFTIHGNRVTVLEPWPGAQKPISWKLNDVPRRVVVTSTTHLPYLELLGVENTLVGFPSTKYISSPKIRQQVADGHITDLGPDGSMNLELLLSLQADVVFAFDMGSESATLDKLAESGITVVYNADFLESTPLGRAEWIRFFGAWFQKMPLADSIFSEIHGTYDSLRSLAATRSHQPSIVSGILYGDTWFMPGGQNGSAQLFADAGGRYLWGSDSTSGWLQISFESVFDRAALADYWIGTGTFQSLVELQQADSRYSAFSPFREKRVYNYHKRIGPNGGYDYFESGYARPDLVLADLIHILHPELLPGYETWYFSPLE